MRSPARANAAFCVGDIWICQSCGYYHKVDAHFSGCGWCDVAALVQGMRGSEARPRQPPVAKMRPIVDESEIVLDHRLVVILEAIGGPLVSSGDTGARLLAELAQIETELAAVRARDPDQRRNAMASCMFTGVLRDMLASCLRETSELAAPADASEIHLDMNMDMCALSGVVDCPDTVSGVTIHMDKQIGYVCTSVIYGAAEAATRVVGDGTTLLSDGHQDEDVAPARGAVTALDSGVAGTLAIVSDHCLLELDVKVCAEFYIDLATLDLDNFDTKAGFTIVLDKQNGYDCRSDTYGETKAPSYVVDDENTLPCTCHQGENAADAGWAAWVLGFGDADYQANISHFCRSDYDVKECAEFYHDLASLGLDDSEVEIFGEGVFGSSCINVSYDSDDSDSDSNVSGSESWIYEMDEYGEPYFKGYLDEYSVMQVEHIMGEACAADTQAVFSHFGRSDYDVQVCAEFFHDQATLDLDDFDVEVFGAGGHGPSCFDFIYDSDDSDSDCNLSGSELRTLGMDEHGAPYLKGYVDEYIVMKGDYIMGAACVAATWHSHGPGVTAMHQVNTGEECGRPSDARDCIHERVEQKPPLLSSVMQGWGASVAESRQPEVPHAYVLCHSFEGEESGRPPEEGGVSAAHERESKVPARNVWLDDVVFTTSSIAWPPVGANLQIVTNLFSMRGVSDGVVLYAEGDVVDLHVECDGVDQVTLALVAVYSALTWMFEPGVLPSRQQRGRGAAEIGATIELLEGIGCPDVNAVQWFAFGCAYLGLLKVGRWVATGLSHCCALNHAYAFQASCSGWSSGGATFSLVIMVTFMRRTDAVSMRVLLSACVDGWLVDACWPFAFSS